VDSSWEVLVLYRKRSGEMRFRYAGMASAGALLIQRLEGSRLGTVVLWVLNGGGNGEGWRKREVIALQHHNQCSGEGLARAVSPAAAEALGSKFETASAKCASSEGGCRVSFAETPRTHSIGAAAAAVFRRSRTS
jgi:hypothetical protein